MHKYDCAKLTASALRAFRSDEKFLAFWNELDSMRVEFDIDAPVPPHRRKRPAQYAEGNAEAFFPENIEDHFRFIYFEAIDTM